MEAIRTSARRDWPAAVGLSLSLVGLFYSAVRCRWTPTNRNWDGVVVLCTAGVGLGLLYRPQADGGGCEP